MDEPRIRLALGVEGGRVSFFENDDEMSSKLEEIYLEDTHPKLGILGIMREVMDGRNMDGSWKIL